MSYRLGIDVGGTFTDVLIIDDADRKNDTHQNAYHPGRSVGWCA